MHVFHWPFWSANDFGSMGTAYSPYNLIFDGYFKVLQGSLWGIEELKRVVIILLNRRSILLCILFLDLWQTFSPSLVWS